jgi:hypothetical protein
VVLDTEKFAIIGLQTMDFAIIGLQIWTFLKRSLKLCAFVIIGLLTLFNPFSQLNTCILTWMDCFCPCGLFT